MYVTARRFALRSTTSVVSDVMTWPSGGLDIPEGVNLLSTLKISS